MESNFLEYEKLHNRLLAEIKSHPHLLAVLETLIEKTKALSIAVPVQQCTVQQEGCQPGSQGEGTGDNNPPRFCYECALLLPQNVTLDNVPISLTFVKSHSVVIKRYCNTRRSDGNKSRQPVREWVSLNGIRGVLGADSDFCVILEGPPKVRAVSSIHIPFSYSAGLGAAGGGRGPGGEGERGEEEGGGDIVLLNDAILDHPEELFTTSGSYKVHILREGDCVLPVSHGKGGGNKRKRKKGIKEVVEGGDDESLRVPIILTSDPLYFQGCNWVLRRSSNLWGSIKSKTAGVCNEASGDGQTGSKGEGASDIALVKSEGKESTPTVKKSSRTSVELELASMNQLKADSSHADETIDTLMNISIDGGLNTPSPPSETTEDGELSKGMESGKGKEAKSAVAAISDVKFVNAKEALSKLALQRDVESAEKDESSEERKERGVEGGAGQNSEMAVASMKRRPSASKEEVNESSGTSSSATGKDTYRQFSGFLEKMKDPTAHDLVKATKIFIHKFLHSKLPVEEQEIAVRSFLDSAYENILSHPLWKNESDEEVENAQEGMEKYLMHKLYSVAFCNKNAGDEKGDLDLSKRIRSLNFLRPEHFDITNGPYHKLTFDLARKEFLKINNFKAPRDKLICILNCCKIIFNLLNRKNSNVGGNGEVNQELKAAGADEFLPMLIYTILSANPPCLYSNIQYIQRFRNPNKMSSESGYYFTNVVCAKEFIDTLDETKLTIDPEEFRSKLQENLSRLDSERGMSRVQSDFVKGLQFAPPIPKYMGCTVEDLDMIDIPKLLEDYKRIGLVAQELFNALSSMDY
eukprot:Nk52_evm21s539 gene=Nk52_evmTU21s539